MKLTFKFHYQYRTKCQSGYIKFFVIIVFVFFFFKIFYQLVLDGFHQANSCRFQNTQCEQEDSMIRFRFTFGLRFLDTNIKKDGCQFL